MDTHNRGAVTSALPASIIGGGIGMTEGKSVDGGLCKRSRRPQLPSAVADVLPIIHGNIFAEATLGPRVQLFRRLGGRASGRIYTAPEVNYTCNDDDTAGPPRRPPGAARTPRPPRRMDCRLEFREYLYDHTIGRFDVRF
ncbi:hypothetical protein EVAR_96723_1 [Eumeta japonica]|uniref:Uncharacterized protein n=1 Tax=Eumeta variegata TaxID=151549 RepID=A0A4C1WGC7_EUMVA|nr:hypothetical protein EVAR_96723_1 [Eumeta japonica]